MQVTNLNGAIKQITVGGVNYSLTGSSYMGTTAEWNNSSHKPAHGELIIYNDNGKIQFKIGDGTTLAKNLAFVEMGEDVDLSGYWKSDYTTLTDSQYDSGWFTSNKTTLSNNGAASLVLIDGQKSYVHGIDLKIGQTSVLDSSGGSDYIRYTVLTGARNSSISLKEDAVGSVVNITSGKLTHNNKNIATEEYVDNAISEGGVGESLLNDNEVFNDYERNVGVAKAFEITSITDLGDDEYCMLHYNGMPNGLETGMRISMQLGKGTYYDCAKIESINPSGGIIRVTMLPETDTTNTNGHDSIHGNFFWVVGHPELGTTDILSQYTHAEGTETEAHFYAAHAEGYLTNALGKYSHAEGRNTTALLGGHAEGLNTNAKGHYSHAEGSMSETQGMYSHAEGSGTYAIGDASHAEGNSAQAVALGSHAEGLETRATGSYSHTEGVNTQAKDYGDHAEGVDTIAESEEFSGAAHAEGHGSYAHGVGAHAEGERTQATKDGAHSEGSNTGATGVSSHAEGDQTQATGIASHAQGIKTTASGAWSHAGGGYSNATGDYSYAQGYKVEATAQSAYATGHQTYATGLGAHSEGIGAGASNEAAHAEGNSTRANGKNSHAEGESTYASNRASHAEGRGTQATAEYAHAEGWNTKATGVASHAGGIGTEAKGTAQTVVGQYNVPTEDAYFIVGNGSGTGVSTSNAFIVKKDGSAELKVMGTNNSSVATKKYVDDAVASSGGGVDLTGYLKSDNLVITEHGNANTYISGPEYLEFTSEEIIVGSGGSDAFIDVDQKSGTVSLRGNTDISLTNGYVATGLDVFPTSVEIFAAGNATEGDPAPTSKMYFNKDIEVTMGRLINKVAQQTSSSGSPTDYEYVTKKYVDSVASGGSGTSYISRSTVENCFILGTEVM